MCCQYSNLLRLNRVRCAWRYLLLFTICASGQLTLAQSSDPAFPTPLTSNEVSGSIAPRDPGDARTTRHFYSLTGSAGEIEIEVEANGLEGDVDIFTAADWRPLVKVPLYATGETIKVAKTFFLRRAERLILRIEARAQGDAEGTYRIRFGGSFAPDQAVAAETPLLPTPPPAKGERRTATGARIENERVEIAESEQASKQESPKAKDERSETSLAKKENKEVPAVPAKEEEKRRDEVIDLSNATGAKETSRSGGRAPGRAPITAPLADGKLVLEMQDGSRIEREMRAIRRLTISATQIIIVDLRGRVERIPMAHVIRIAIER